jgi:hypothetical protein
MPEGYMEPGGGGGGAESSTIIFTAGQNLSSGRAVIKEADKVYYFDPNDVSHAGRVIGITTTSASTDDSVPVQIAGTLTDAAFSFTVDKPVYIADNGQLTTDITTTTLLQRAGLSLATDKMIIEFDFSMVRT